MMLKMKKKVEREVKISKKNEKDAIFIEEDAVLNEVEDVSDVENALKMQKDKLQQATLLLHR